MTANSTQVGGTHYRAAYQHWDYVHDLGLGYMEGQITRYISRARKKNGFQDLQKAMHYLDKMRELCSTPAVQRPRVPTLVPSAREYVRACTQEFCTSMQLTPVEHEALLAVVLWSSEEDLIRARDKVLAIMRMEFERAPENLPEPAPVPLTEENHYAPRAFRESE